MNLAEPLRQHARARGDRAAIVHGERTIRYADLDLMVQRRAAHLIDQGLAPDDVVGVALRDDIEHVTLLFSLARAGLVMLPLDWRWTNGEQARVATHFGAKLVLCDPAAAPLEGIDCLPIDVHWQQGVATADAAREFAAGDAPLLMSLSSGTTGRPKGPRLMHSHFLARFRVMWMNLGFNSQDRYVSATPLYFGGGRTFAMLMLYSGATLVMVPPPYEPHELCEEIDRRDATAIFLVPTLLRRLLALPDATLAPFRRMRLVLSSGAALHFEERRAVRERICKGFVEYYSSTEGGGISYLTSEDPAQFDESVGRPVFGVDVQCVDASHRPLAPGVIGRIRYRGPAVAATFWNDPEASAEAFRDGWYYPGDLGMQDEHGYIYLKGRAKEMIIRGGVNIYPAEIEAILQTHLAVGECAVVGWPSRAFNEEIAAFVIATGATSVAALRDHCARQLAAYKVPREIFIVDELPRSSLGKILKTALQARLVPL